MSGKSACAGIGFWALTPVCGPYPDASVRLAAGSFLPWALPVAGFAGTGDVHSDGLDAARIIKPQGPSCATYPLMGLYPLGRTSLQRIAGLMPCPSGHLRVSPGSGSLSQVSHLP